MHFKENKKNQGIKQSMTNTYVKWYLDKGGELLSDILATKIKNVLYVKKLEQVFVLKEEKNLLTVKFVV